MYKTYFNFTIDARIISQFENPCYDYAMATARDRILVVESDPVISDLISRQALQSIGFQVQVVGDATTAIPQIIQFAPDAVIVDLNLPGLSGKDLLVALSSQGVRVPVIVIAQKGMEADIIQAFRLGAADYLVWPLREAEVVAAVERVLRQVHERREREQLSRQLQQTNQELQNRVRELTTIFAVGKAVTSITDQRALFDKIMEGALRVTDAEIGWFLLRDENQKNFVLMAQRNLPPTVLSSMNQTWDDGISSLVAMSGEPLAIHGEPLKRFKVAQLGQATLIVPIKIQKSVIGLLVVVRKAPRPFTPSEQNLLEAMADYASISLVNARLFRALEERANSLQQMAENAQIGEKIQYDLLQSASRELTTPLGIVKGYGDMLSAGQMGKLNNEQKQALASMQAKVQEVSRIVEAMSNQQMVASTRQFSMILINDLVRQTASRYQRTCQQANLTLSVDLATDPLQAVGDPAQITQVLDALLSNAVKFTPAGGSIRIAVQKTREYPLLITVADSGIGMDPKMLANVFEHRVQSDPSATHRFGGLGIRLALVKEIISAHGGKIWVESKAGEGSLFSFTLRPGK